MNTNASKSLSDSLHRLLHRISPGALNRRSTAAERGSVELALIDQGIYHMQTTLLQVKKGKGFQKVVTKSSYLFVVNN